MIETCKHCRRPIENGLHLEGVYRGKHRCDPDDSQQPYGYEAEPEGTYCSERCLGYTKPVEPPVLLSPLEEARLAGQREGWGRGYTEGRLDGFGQAPERPNPYYPAESYRTYPKAPRLDTN